jgi:phenylacetate-CoA ligase
MSEEKKMSEVTAADTAGSDPYYFQPELEKLPRDQLEALQFERLQSILAHAYANVAHFRNSFDAAGVKPDDLNSLDDLAKFPFTVKTDLRDNYPFNMFAVPLDQVVRVHASSGTTGKPTVVGYTRGDIDNWSDLMARSIACAGGRPGELLHNAYGYGLFTGGLGAHYGAERLGCTVTPMSGGNTERQIVLLNDFGARVLCATPSYALNIAEMAEAEGVDLAGGPLRVGVFGAEPWSEAMRAELDRRLGIRSVDIYGLSEIMGPGVACECHEERAGLHGWEDHFLFEIIDPESGAPLPMGEAGELVITTLTKQALPMIRYRTRDITKLSTEPCSCGRTHVRILRVTGRNDDMLIIRGVNVYPSQIESVMVGFDGIAPHYQLVVRREGTLDTLGAEIEAAPETAAGDYERLAGEIRPHIKSLIGVTCKVELKAPGEVPRSQGKAVRVRDERPKG